MIVLWVAAALLSAAAAALIVRLSRRAEAVSGEDPSVGVYKRQLHEIDDLAAQGLLAEAEARTARTEAARRLLDAAGAPAPAAAASTPWGGRSVLIAALAAPVLAAGLYAVLGRPDLPDQPFADRLEAWRRGDPAALGVRELRAVLEAIAAERPGQAEPLVFLARVQAAAGDGFSAVRSLERAVALTPGDASLWAALGEARAAQAKGEVVPAAAEAFDRALRLDPGNPSARYHLARRMIAGGEVEAGLKAWTALAAELPAGDPNRAGLDREIARVRAAGGLGGAPALAEALEADPEQAAFVRSMVDGLAARLKDAPDDPEGWARLMRAYRVLGDAAALKTAEAEVRRIYKDRPALAAQIEATAAAAR